MLLSGPPLPNRQTSSNSRCDYFSHLRDGGKLEKISYRDFQVESAVCTRNDHHRVQGITAEILAENIKKFGHKNVNYIGGIETATQKVIDSLNPGDLVITLGAGSITGLSDEILEALKDKEAAGQ